MLTFIQLGRLARLPRLLTALGLCSIAASASAGTGPTPKAVAPPATQALHFIPNHHQWPDQVLFATDVPGGRLFLERNRLTHALYDVKAVDELHHHTASPDRKTRIKAHAFSVTFVGANPQAAVNGEAETGDVNNYFLGSDPKKWATNVPAFAQVRYQQLYPGTALRFYTKGKQLEYDFELAPGAEASQIRLRYEGQQQLRVVAGALHITTSVGKVVEQRPYAYQMVGGKQMRVACEYALGPNGSVAFTLAKGYNHSLPLIIDPVLVYSSYTGSTASNYGYTATYDSLGNLYTGGVVFGPGFPTTTGAYDISYANSQDMGIMKFDPSASFGTTSRIYATYIGGSSDDHPHSMVVDHAGNLVILGSSGSGDFPTTIGAYDRTANGDADIVLCKLNAAGAALLSSTFVGGSGVDGQVGFGSPLNKNYGDAYRGDVTIDRLNNVYFASITESANFPVLNAFQTTRRGSRDAVVVKINPTMTALGWSTFMGGTADDAGYSIQLDSVNNVFVSGGTSSSNFPGTTGGVNSLYRGGSADGFVARIASTGDDLVQASYIGTPAYDQAYFVQLNSRGEVYLYGQTDGTYPLTPGVYSNPGSRQFIHKINPLLTNTLFSTAIGNGPGGGGSTNLSPTAFLVDTCGQIMLSGWGRSSDLGNMPITPNAIQTNNPSGGFGSFYIMQLSDDGRRLIYGTYFGDGSCHVDGGTSRFDKKGIIYQAMCAGSGNTPLITTPNAFSATNRSSWNNAAFKIDVLQLNPAFVQSVIPNGPRFRTGCAPLRLYFTREPSGTSVLWNFGDGATSTTQGTVVHTYDRPGLYIIRLTVTDINSCVQTATATDTVMVTGLQATALGPDRTICNSGSTRLVVPNAEAAAVITWFPPNGLNTVVGDTVIASPLATTSYIVRVASPSGCVGFDTIQVNVAPTPQVDLGADRTICPGDSVELSVASVAAGSTVTWSPPLGLSTTTGATVMATPSVGTEYTALVSTADGSCQVQNTVRVDIFDKPVVKVLMDSTSQYINQPVTFTTTTSTGVTAYAWTFGDGGTSTEQSPTHTYATPGNYPVSLTATYGSNCKEVLAIGVVVVQDPMVPNVITPHNKDNMNDTFKPMVSAEPVELKIYNRWGREVFADANYVEGWGSGVSAGVYYYLITKKNGETWKGWVEVMN